jgi:glucose-6-phosphate 1-epimerase
MRLVQQSLGAQLLQVQWQGSDLPLFDLSPITLRDAPRRGGVPILFPQFADRGALAKHGFARNLSWHCLEQTSAADQSRQSAHYRLDIGRALLPEWPYAASLNVYVNCQPNQLQMRLQICNTGTQAFDWTGGLHPYFYVDDLLQAHLLGLADVSCEDRYATDLSALVPNEVDVRFDGQPLERLYLDTPTLELVQAQRRIKLDCTGFSQWMIWNPGQAGETLFSDLPPGDWRRFICIEPVIAKQAHRLEPTQVFEGMLHVQLMHV